jgi:hypothetical protein
MPSASDTLTAGLGESGSRLDMAEAERTCGLRSERFFGGGVGVSDICGGHNTWTTRHPNHSIIFVQNVILCWVWMGNTISF